jgi:hypothetical protein
LPNHRGFEDPRNGVQRRETEKRVASCVIGEISAGIAVDSVARKVRITGDEQHARLRVAALRHRFEQLPLLDAVGNRHCERITERTQRELLLRDLLVEGHDHRHVETSTRLKSGQRRDRLAQSSRARVRRQLGDDVDDRRQARDRHSGCRHSDGGRSSGRRNGRRNGRWRRSLFDGGLTFRVRGGRLLFRRHRGFRDQPVGGSSRRSAPTRPGA